MKNFELVSTNVTLFCVTRFHNSVLYLKNSEPLFTIEHKMFLGLHYIVIITKYSYFIITMKKLISLFIPELLTLSFIVFNAF